MGNPRAKVYVDVTNTLSVPFTTGIQRAVKEILKRLPRGESAPFELVLVARTGTGWRELTAAEQLRFLPPPVDLEALTASPVPSVPSRALARMSRNGVWRRVAARPQVKRARLQSDRVRNRIRRERLRREHIALDGVEFAPGSIFFDIEASWHFDDRAEVLPELRAAGVRTGALIYDTLPVERPDWFASAVQQKFERHLDAQLAHSDFLATISDHVNGRLVSRLAEHYGDREAIDPTTVRLGADFAGASPVRPNLPRHADRFLLSVGTIEPRKNHETLLDAFDLLLRDELDPGQSDDIPPHLKGVCLVLVGREGWLCQSTVRRIRNHPTFGRRIFWFPKLGDGHLRWLYQSASAVVMPSFDEGLGLPVLEGLAAGCMVIASDTGSLREAGGEIADYFDPVANDAAAQLARVIRLVVGDVDHQAFRRRQLVHYVGPSWEGATDDVVRLLIREAHTAQRSKVDESTLDLSAGAVQ